MSRTCPCKGCVAPKRHSGCHSHCPEYIEWNIEHQQDLEKARAIQKEEQDYDSTLLRNRRKKRRMR